MSNFEHRRIIIFVGGYALAGKSEFIKIARKHGYPCFSSSELLHEAYRRIYLRFNGSPIDTSDKTRNIYSYPEGNALKRLINLRTDLIFLAEQILTKIFSRAIFACAIMEKMLTIDLEEEPISFIETIGGDEYDKFIFLASRYYPDARILNLNIRRDSESPGIDTRKLLEKSKEDIYYNGVTEIHNNGTKEEFEEKVLNYVDGVLNLLCLIDQLN